MGQAIQRWRQRDTTLTLASYMHAEASDADADAGATAAAASAASAGSSAEPAVTLTEGYIVSSIRLSLIQVSLTQRVRGIS